MSLLARRLASALASAPIAMAAVFVLAVAVLVPAIGAPGLWEPQERQLADRLAPRLGSDSGSGSGAGSAGSGAGSADAAVRHDAAPPATAAAGGKPGAVHLDGKKPPPPPESACPKVAPPDALARSLTGRAATWGRDHLDDTDGGRRLPLAVLAVLTVLAIAGIALRTAGPRAGVIAALIALSFPLLVLQARQLTSEIGTAAGGALIVYGLTSLARGRGVVGLISDAVSLIAVAVGVAVGFLGGGALLGLIVPLGAVAAAGGLGAPAVRAIAVMCGRGLAAAGRIFAGRRSPRGAHVASPWVADPAEALIALVATLAVIALFAVLAPQLYALGGHSVKVTGCWSSALGGVWKPEDDLRITYDSAFEQIAYGTYPWGVLAPFALIALLGSADARRRRLAGVLLAWAGGAWIATEVFERKVGFAVYGGFPALAVALGVWLDDLFARRAADRATRTELPPGALLLALFAGLAVLDLGKDVQEFGERLTSLLVGGDAISYPGHSRLLLIPTKLWVLGLGLIVGVAFALTLALWTRRIARWALAVAIGGTVVCGAFWSFGWQPTLSRNLSTKSMFETVTELRAPGDQLVLMGDLDNAARDYVGSDWTKVASRAQVMTALARPNRVFAIAPAAELCSIHHDAAGKPYFVLDDSNVRVDPNGHPIGGELVLSNKLDGGTDHNPLASEILFSEPTTIGTRAKGRIVYDNKVQLIGWTIPKSVPRGGKFTMTLFYKALSPVGGAWQNFTHFDFGGLRFNGDHFPINDHCATGTWQKNDYIVDTYTVTAGGPTFPLGPYEIWTGLFTGTNPNWKNMPVSEAPGDMRDNADRVKIGTIDVN